MEALPRRQNKSCDRCRRSKRRCVIAREDRPHQRCRNCLRLGDNCTFELAAALTAKKRQRVSANTEQEIVEQISTTDIDLDAPPPNVTVRANNPSHDWCSPSFFGSFDNIWSPPSFTSATLHFDDLFDDLLNGSSGFDDGSISIPDPSMRITANSNHDLVQLPVNHAEITPKRPMSLLTSTFTFSMPNDYLNRFFHSLTTVLYHRYLSPRANLAARTARYEILPNDPASKVLVNAGDADPESNSTSYSDVRDTGGETVQVSVIGAARFLDNFALLYGNHRARGDQQKDENTLYHVMHAVALGNSPLSPRSGEQADDPDKLFADAWFQAYNSLVESMSRRSFVLIYAVFTFDLTCTPPEAVSVEHPEIDSKTLLRNALKQLRQLSDLINSFRSHLDNSSKYGRHIETCLRIMMWHGYVRDTVFSMIRRQSCVLEDMPRSPENPIISGLTPDSEDLATLDKDVPMICEYAFGEIFAAWRLVVATETEILADEYIDAYTATRDLSSLKEMLQSFQARYNMWMQRCMDCFPQLSTKSQLSIGFLAIFWNLTTLRVFDIISDRKGIAAFDSHDLILITEYRRCAVTAYARISRLIMEVSEEKDLPVLDQSDVKLPFLAHHANSVLVVCALETAIKHTVAVINNEPQDYNGELTSALKPLCWCLLSLEKTSAGRTVARPALNRLLAMHGDILLGSWHPEEDESSFDNRISAF